LEKSVELKNGAAVRIRPLEAEDAERLYWFLGGLTDEDRRYLRTDVNDRDLVIQRARQEDPSLVVHLIAENGKEIIAEALLETPGPGWDEDIGEVRILVAPEYRRKGLGFVLARELYFVAVEKRLRKVMARIMRPQSGARRILRRLGFSEEVLLPDHVRDQDGQIQDLFLMSADLEDLRRELGTIFESSDWRRHR
jgi:RimJ/RimL family protein N-acetyltransferase